MHSPIKSQLSVITATWVTACSNCPNVNGELRKKKFPPNAERESKNMYFSQFSCSKLNGAVAHFFEFIFVKYI